MPRFYLHLRNGDDLVEDPDESDLPNAEAVKEEARTSARYLLAERLREGKLIDGQRFEIVDEVENSCAVVGLREVIRFS
ncbi:hypothetical protein MKK68_19710 [Methylobacterium sp. E-016]|jgi:hypothetical protein|uniref:DUF6894 family protein n=1 Tax=Methylobacterium sp. E-016 TaxID=2836556 RepID=UPI001FB97EA5|nr:hypothetical protein [Methylobacterium sp. E-016]MCJ2077841.1 hypothetical protein [Methylobacterium sp. E-016]